MEPGRPQFTDEPGESRRDAILIRLFGLRGARVISAIIEIVEIIVLALALVMLIRVFLVQSFYVKGESMEPTHQNREYLIIDKLSYRFHEPQRGEVVVFRYPADPSEYFIKRVIGLPGEIIAIENESVMITNVDHPNGRVLDESYLPVRVATAGSVRITLGSDEYFLLGDNRNVSLDSRVFGPVRRDFIVGRAWLRGWPPSRVGVLATPSYQGEL